MPAPAPRPPSSFLNGLHRIALHCTDDAIRGLSVDQPINQITNQSWNKFCFTGGVVEISAILPGRGEVGGLWPAMWLMGNLARATYTASSDFIWPWSYNQCNRSTEEQA